MKNKIITILFFLSFSTVYAVAAEKESPNLQVPSLRISPLALEAEQLRKKATGQGEKLRFREIEAVNLSKKWQDKYDEPALGEGGRVIYHFGESLHSVICRVLDVTDIELQPGEMIKPHGVQIGDKVRWKVTPILSGNGLTNITHLIIKPTASNLNTTMVVATDRRTYHFNLKSTKRKYMASVAFSYPDDQKIEWQQYYAAATKEKENKTIDATDGTKLLIDELSFNYKITGDTPPWLPVRVFNDGQKTYIQMPRAMKQFEAPVFLALDKSGDEKIVNYRLRGDKFIVDSLFSEGILITGVGRRQEKVKIIYEGEKI